MYSNLSSTNGNSAQLPPDPLYSPISSPYNVSTDLPLSPPPPPYTPYQNQDSYGLTNTTSISSPPAQVSYQNYSSNNPPFNGNNPLLQHPNLQNIPDPQLRSKKSGHVDYPPPSPPTGRPLPPIPVNMESSHPPIPVNMAPPLSRSESTASTLRTLRSNLFPRNTIFAQSNSRGTNETSSDINRRCRICTNVFPVTEFSQITSHCRHGNDACSKCIRRHIRIELSKENENIRCLSLDGCRNVLQETDVQRLANEDDFKRYQQISIKSTLSQIPDFQWCINPECGSGQIHEAGDTAPIMTCESCSQKQCVIHKRPIPRGSQCDKCSRPSQSSTSSVTNHDDDYAIALCLSNWDDMGNHSQSSNSTTSSTFRQNPGQSSFDTATTTNSNNNTSNSEPQDCIICADTITAGDMVRATSRCRHESEICRTCMARHIEVELSDKGNFKIRCPNADGCVEELEEADVRRLAAGEAFERYQKLQINFSLSRIDEFKWCANPQCRSGQLHGSGEAQPIMTCNECGQKQCVIHDLPLRNENRCVECEKARRIAKVPQQEVDDLAIALTLQNLIDEERQAAKEAARLAREREAAAAEAARQAEAARIAEEDRRRRDETKSTGLISSVTKACPKCKTRIEKNGGCDHMTCKAPGCGYEFYWSNLRPYPR